MLIAQAQLVFNTNACFHETDPACVFCSSPTSRSNKISKNSKNSPRSSGDMVGLVGRGQSIVRNQWWLNACRGSSKQARGDGSTWEMIGSPVLWALVSRLGG